MARIVIQTDDLGLLADTGTTAYVQMPSTRPDNDIAPGLPTGDRARNGEGYFVLVVTGTERTAETLPATSVTRYDTV